MSLAFGFALPHWQPLSGGFSPASLFTGGTAGAWYDPSDLSTMFDTSAGTTPVAMPGQGAAVPVGLMLDKSQGLVLGPELITPAANRDFSSNTGYWTIAGSITITGGQAVYTSAGSLNGIYRTGFTTAGTYYEVTFTVGSITAGALRVYAGGNRTANVTTAGTYTQRVVAGSTDTLLIFECFGTTTLTLDDVSVKVVSGNHAIAFNDTTARPELRARVNLLTYSEEFDNGAWTKTNATAANTSATTDPLGGTTAEIITALAGTAGKFVRQNLTVPSNVTFSVYAKANTQRYIQLVSDGDTEAYANFDLQAGAGQTGTKGTKTTSSITDVGNGWYRCVATFTNATAGVSARVFFVDNASALWFANSTTTGAYYLWGADLRPANIGANVPAYQRIADANTYDTSGFPLYLLFEGAVGQRGMYTPANLNLSGTDKVAVFAGVRKLSDAALGLFAEFSNNAASNSGAFYFAAPINTGASGNYGFYSRGSVAAPSGANSSALLAPRTSVVAGLGDISGDLMTLRVDGTQVATNTSDQGTGNYGTYPLYIGSRANSSLWFNGQLYSLIAAGSAVSAGNISATEQWVAGKTGIAI